MEWLEIQKDFLLNFLLSNVDEDFDENSDILVFEGDIFHSRELINVKIHNEALAIFTILAKKFKRGIYIIVGNHDAYYKDKNEVHSLKAISNLANNIYVFEAPEILTMNDKHSFLMLPWVDDIPKLNSIIQDHQTLCSYIICHADIKNFRFNKWVTVDKGLEPDVLANYTRVYSGHIHHRQESGNVLYTGAPYQMDRGDIGNTKGYYQLTLTDSEITEKFIRNSKSPEFIKVNMFDLLEMSAREICNLIRNNFVDVMLLISFANKISIPTFLEELTDSKHRRIEFFTYTDQAQNQITMKTEFNADDGFNITDIFKMYLKAKDYSMETKTKLAKKFVELHNAVKLEKSYD
jgi:DNA repair exonuclease SbcCD nuclease subunit